MTLGGARRKKLRGVFVAREHERSADQPISPARLTPESARPSPLSGFFVREAKSRLESDSRSSESPSTY
jgi:hypothetical protein